MDNWKGKGTKQEEVRWDDRDARDGKIKKRDFFKRSEGLIRTKEGRRNIPNITTILRSTLPPNYEVVKFMR